MEINPNNSVVIFRYSTFAILTPERLPRLNPSDRKSIYIITSSLRNFKVVRLPYLEDWNVYAVLRHRYVILS